MIGPDLEETRFYQALDDKFGGSLWRQLTGIEVNFQAQQRLIRTIDFGEILNLAGFRLLVPSFDIALLGQTERNVQMPPSKP